MVLRNMFQFSYSKSTPSYDEMFQITLNEPWTSNSFSRHWFTSRSTLMICYFIFANKCVQVHQAYQVLNCPVSKRTLEIFRSPVFQKKIITKGLISSPESIGFPEYSTGWNFVVVFMLQFVIHCMLQIRRKEPHQGNVNEWASHL